jgi:hypothetical protein
VVDVDLATSGAAAGVDDVVGVDFGVDTAAAAGTEGAFGVAAGVAGAFGVAAGVAGAFAVAAGVAGAFAVAAGVAGAFGVAAGVLVVPVVDVVVVCRTGAVGVDGRIPADCKPMTVAKPAVNILLFTLIGENSLLDVGVPEL